MGTSWRLWIITGTLAALGGAFPGPPSGEHRPGASPTAQQEDTQTARPIRYRLVEGSTLIDDCTACGRPTFQVPIRGEFWLTPVGQNPLFSNFEVRGMRFASVNPQFAYKGEGHGTYLIGGEVALVQQMTLDVRINGGGTLQFDTGLVPVSTRFPWIEIDIPQQSPTNPLHVFTLHIVASPWPSIWFSTTGGFTSSRLGMATISDGDLLSSEGRVVRTNQQLTARLGIMPNVPDLGLDAVALPVLRTPAATAIPSPETWFSTTRDTFSETLGQLHHGDLLSDAGRVVRPYSKLLAAFCPQPPVADFGLDAVAFAPDGTLLFSTGESFFSECLGEQIGHGDLLREDGKVYQRNSDLLAAFHPVSQPPADLGLDAVVVWPNSETWFSVSIDFEDARWGHVGHGDLLSDTGHIVMRNRELLAPFGPVEDVADFGLDALVIAPFAPVNEFDECGVLVTGAECLLFGADGGGLYILEHLGGFQPGDRVRVRGVLNRSCLSTCQQGDGCIVGNSIEACKYRLRRHL